MDKTIEAVAEMMEDTPCRACDYWDVQGHYCYARGIANNFVCALYDAIRQIFIKHLREVVEGAGLTDEEIKEKLGEIQPEGFDWVNITEAEMYKFRAIDQLQLQAILNLKALEKK